VDIDNKLNNYLKITGIVNNMLRPQKTLNKTRLKLYNTLALTALLCGSQNCAIEARDAGKITGAEEKYSEKNSRIYLDRLYNKHRYCKRTEHNLLFLKYSPSCCVCNIKSLTNIQSDTANYLLLIITLT
jgi:hypothetical protein